MIHELDTTIVKRTPPGPGQPLSLFDLRRSPLEFITEMTQQYGPIVRYQADRWLVTLLNHPDYVKRVLQDHWRNYSKENTPDFMMLKPMLGEGLLTSEGESWLWQRRMAQPAFHRKRIEGFGSLITDLTLAMIGRWQRQYADTGQPLEMVEEMTQLTLCIVAKALFGYEIAGAADKFGRAVEILNECIGHYDPANAGVYRQMPVAIRTIRGTIEEIIAERRVLNDDRGDFLSLLLSAHDQEGDSRMNDQQVRDQMVTLLLAGHETTAKVLSWTFYLLSQHPQVEQQLHQELQSVLGKRMPETADLAALPYTWMVLEEAMRLYPPVWAFSRIAVQDDEIGGYHIPAGSLVTFSPYTMHRHPDYWQKPDCFYPEHFRPDLVEARPEFAYFPFGGGPRLCLGKHFASFEAHLVLATICQHFRLRLVPNHPVQPEALVTLRPQHGLPMTLQPA